MVNNENDGSSLMDEFTHIKQVRVLGRIMIEIGHNDDMTWYYTNENAMKICNALKIKESYLKKILKDMKDLGILLSRGKGVYVVPKKYIQIKESSL